MIISRLGEGPQGPTRKPSPSLLTKEKRYEQAIDTIQT